jgi:hypothetical protein
MKSFILSNTTTTQYYYCCYHIIIVINKIPQHCGATVDGAGSNTFQQDLTSRPGFATAFDLFLSHYTSPKLSLLF